MKKLPALALAASLILLPAAAGNTIAMHTVEVWG